MLPHEKVAIEIDVHRKLESRTSIKLGEGAHPYGSAARLWCGAANSYQLPRQPHAGRV
jgi:hypothetical protein